MKQRIKIAMISIDLSRTGISTVMMNYCRNLNKDDFQVDIMVGNHIVPEYKQECEELGIQIIELPFKHDNSKEYFISLWKALSTKKYDIAHIHGNSAMITPELLIAWARGIKVRIAHSHNTTCDHIRLNKILKPIFNKVYTHGFACGLSAGKWMFGNRKFEIIPNGIIVNNYKFDYEKRRFLREKIGVTNEVVLGHVGKFNEQKNHKFLLEIFSGIASKNAEVKLLLVGEGPDFHQIVTSIKRHPYKDRIIVYGESNEMDYIYSAIDCLLLPSLYEGLPLVLVEAQAAGLPCLVSDSVDRNSGLTRTIDFLPITDVDCWIDRLEQIINNGFNRVHRCQENQIKIKESGYDIATNVIKLQKLYNSFCR